MREGQKSEGGAFKAPPPQDCIGLMVDVAQIQNLLQSLQEVLQW